MKDKRKVIVCKRNDTVCIKVSDSVSLSISQISTGFGQGDMDYRISFHDRLTSHGFGFRQVRHLSSTVNRILGRLAENFVEIHPAEEI